ncbi:hypothetical protein A2482_01100 [Candidatus Falkowbacteria bacterium RIFOXYC2_FULL_48_21]|uniref:Uncharacterized protein n=1 Tax=Candidatus Falkowbacteria bacterium RIFOXYC2_FULL_48_21 TaxID=1798005 RepID=A0A1F5T7W6_9BACT|nr:MAG: hypothetical protein A2482_01100 [Candidatus Falkowbacteria bacterium RIFOXYC2_FULL_48_21]
MFENLFLLFFIASVALSFISILLYRSKKSWRFGTLTFSAGVIALICGLLSINNESDQRVTQFGLSTALMFLYLWLCIFSNKEEKPAETSKTKPT